MDNTIIAAGALAAGAILVSRSETVATAAEEATNRDLTDANNATGEDRGLIADRTADISDEVDEAVRNEERFAGSPVSPYQ